MQKVYVMVFSCEKKMFCLMSCHCLLCSYCFVNCNFCAAVFSKQIGQFVKMCKLRAKNVQKLVYHGTLQNLLPSDGFMC